MESADWVGYSFGLGFISRQQHEWFNYSSVSFYNHATNANTYCKNQVLILGLHIVWPKRLMIIALMSKDSYDKGTVRVKMITLFEFRPGVIYALFQTQVRYKFLGCYVR